MTLPRRWFNVMFRRSTFERQMRDELNSHLAYRVADLVAQGVSNSEARRQAKIEFGAVEGAKEECREASGLRWPDELQRNLRFATRMLVKSSAFTLTAVITLGLCIGANTAIFSVVDAVLFRPLPYPEPDRLGMVVTRFQNGDAGSTNLSQSGKTWEVVRDRTHRVRSAVYSGWATGVNFVASERAEFLQQQRVGTGFFSVLGVEPFIGREFSERSRELGVRMALGATRVQAIRLAAAPGIGLTMAGLALGYVLSRWTLASMSHLLYGVSTRDPETFLVVAAILIVVAGVASFLPALAVAGLDPVRVLRD